MMQKKIKIISIILLALFIGIIIFNFIRSYMINRFFKNYTPPPIAVSSITAEKISWSSTIPAVGNFSAVFGVDVNSQISGNVTEILFKSGDIVQENQPLINLDDSVEQATLAYDEADLTLQNLNYKRQLDLLKHGATAAASADEAKAKLLKAQANVHKTEAIISQKHIKAPFSGKAGINLIALGQYITPGQTPIVSLQSMDPIYLEFYIPEQFANQIYPTQPINFAIENIPNMQFTGEIFALNSKVDINTHTIKVRAILPNCPQEALLNPEKSKLITIKPESKTASKTIICNSDNNKKNNITKYSFIPGMFANINIILPQKESVVALPSTAISFTLYGNSVFVIDDTDQKHLKVHRVFVTTGEQKENYTVINTGVKPGQLIVESGELKLNDGAAVTINNSIHLNQHNTQTLGE